MRKIYLMLSLMAALFTTSCSNSDNDLDTARQTRPSKNENTISRTSESGGVKYTLKDLAINEKLITLTTNDVELLSSKNDLEKGIYKINLLNTDLANKMQINNSIYMRLGEGAHLRVIKNVEKVNQTTYVLSTELGQLTDLFESGSIEFDVDVAKAEELKRQREVLANGRTKAGVDINFDILKYIKEYKADGMVFNPNASLKSRLHFSISFDKFLSLFPMQFEVTYEIMPNINPYFMFDKLANKKYHTDLLANLPTEIYDLLGKIEIEMDIPAGSYGIFPGKVSINKLYMPLNVFANVSKDAKLEYNINGSLKVGYAYYNPILGKKSGFIYQNNITKSSQITADMTGEVFSDIYLQIEPKVVLVDLSLFDVKGNVSLGVEAITTAKINTAGQREVASKAVAKATGSFDVYFRGNKFMTTELLNESMDLWSYGTVDKTLTMSNLKMVKPTTAKCRTNSFSYNMTVDYRYFVAGKKIPGDLTVTYDVYDDKGRVLKASNKFVLTEAQTSASNTLSFNVCLPFRYDLLGIGMGNLRPSTYVRNMTFTDAYGYKGVLPDFEVGSPYNTNFWK